MKARIFNPLKGAALVGAMSLAVSASAQVTSINFTLPDNTYDESILNYYNGGADQNGAIGPNDGISFSPGALALLNFPATDGSYYSNAGNEPGGGDSMIFLSEGGAYMNVPGGFRTGFSFFYASPGIGGSVSVYSGLNGTGTLLATLNLGITPNGVNPPFDLPFNYGVWDPAGVSFAGTAESVSFGGATNYIAFSDVTLGASAPADVPDNSGASIYGLAAATLAAGAWASRKLASAI